MKVTPSKDFPYSLDGIKATRYKKGVAVNIPDGVVEKLKKAGGYLEGYDKEETPSTGANSNPTVEVALLEITGMKKNFISVLNTIGVETVAQLKEKSVEQLAALDGISEKIAEQLLKAEVK